MRMPKVNLPPPKDGKKALVQKEEDDKMEKGDGFKRASYIE